MARHFEIAVANANLGAIIRNSKSSRMVSPAYGQEKVATTSGLTRMNMILHNNPGASIVQGNTLANPNFLEGANGHLERMGFTW